jgi:hypothetical protein
MFNIASQKETIFTCVSVTKFDSFSYQKIVLYHQIFELNFFVTIASNSLMTFVLCKFIITPLKETLFIFVTKSTPFSFT